MLGFWLSASAMIAVALAFVLPALVARRTPRGPSRDDVNLAIYRDRRAELQAEHDAGNLDNGALEAALVELDRELLHDVGDAAPGDAGAHARTPYPAIVIAVLLPLVAFGAYLELGTPRALLEDTSPRTAGGASATTAGGERIPHSVKEMVARLEQRMRQHPEDPEGWLMLGRSYAAMNRLPDAEKALREADRRRPDHPMTLVALAEVLAGLGGDRLDGEPIELVRRALALEPGFPRGLWLAGIYAFNHDDRARARELWQRLLATPGLSPDAMAQIREALVQAGAQAGTQAPAAAPRTATAAGPSITVNVTVSPEIKSRIDGNETLFVFARAASGPPMPLAVVRRHASELPLRVTLDDTMAMAPQLKLSAFDPVVVSARVSRSGGATPSPGDLEGRSAPVSPSTAGPVSIVIDHVVE